MRKTPGFTAMLSATALVGSLAILAITLIPAPPPARSVPGITVSLAMSVAVRQLSSPEIGDPDRTWVALGDKAVTARSQYVYVRGTIANAGPDDRSLVIQNGARNYSTAFLTPSSGGFAEKFRQGDPVPAGESPLRHLRASFPLNVRAGESESFVLEYLNERDSVIDPAVFDSAAWFNRAGAERDIVTFVSAAVFCLTLLNLVAGAMLFRGELIRLSFLTFSLLFFFMRQSRLLLLLANPLPYAEWLYPLSIGFELVSAHLFFGYLMGRNFFPWQRWAYRILAALTVVTVAVSFFVASYTMADILNVFAMVTLVIVLVGVINAIRNRDWGVLQVMLAFAPWISMMAIEIVIIYVVPRPIFLADYRQAFGMLLTLVLVTVTGVYRRNCAAEDRVASLAAERDEAVRALARGADREGEAAERARAGFETDCAPSLRGILSAAGTLRREYADPGVVAASGVISSEAARIGEILGKPRWDTGESE